MCVTDDREFDLLIEPIIDDLKTVQLNILSTFLPSEVPISPIYKSLVGLRFLGEVSNQKRPLIGKSAVWSQSDGLKAFNGRYINRDYITHSTAAPLIRRDSGVFGF